MFDPGSAIPATEVDPRNRALAAEMARFSNMSREATTVKLEQQFRIDRDMASQQLRSMLMYTERALSNEASNRMLSSMFGKFGLIQKIVQNMG